MDDRIGYHLMLRCHPNDTAQIKNYPDYPMTEVVQSIGVSNLVGGYENKFGLWSYKFTVLSTELIAGSFIRALAEAWVLRYGNTAQLYADLAIGWMKEGQLERGVIVESTMLNKLVHPK